MKTPYNITPAALREAQYLIYSPEENAWSPAPLSHTHITQTCAPGTTLSLILPDGSCSDPFTLAELKTAGKVTQDLINRQPESLVDLTGQNPVTFLADIYRRHQDAEEHRRAAAQARAIQTPATPPASPRQQETNAAPAHAPASPAPTHIHNHIKPAIPEETDRLIRHACRVVIFCGTASIYITALAIAGYVARDQEPVPSLIITGVLILSALAIHYCLQPSDSRKIF